MQNAATRKIINVFFNIFITNLLQQAHKLCPCSSIPMYICSNLFLQSPLRRNSVISPVFVHRNNFIIFEFYKWHYVKRSRFIGVVYVNGSYNEVANLFRSLDCTVPCSRISAIRPYIFFHSELFISTVPVDICRISKLFIRSILKRAL